MNQLDALEDARRVWVDGHGPSTVGEIRRTEQTPALDDESRTVSMWRFIATHPDARPWLSGPTHADCAGSIA